MYQYIWKMLLTYQYFSFESVHAEAMLKMGWVVKKWNFSFWTATNWSKCILMVSVYIWLSIYANNAILCIIWKFDLSSRGVLGRIYALSIEVLRAKWGGRYGCRSYTSVISYEIYETSPWQVSYEMTTCVHFCLSYDRFKLDFIFFKVDNISKENATLSLSRTSLWRYMYDFMKWPYPLNNSDVIW